MTNCTQTGWECLAGYFHISLQTFFPYQQHPDGSGHTSANLVVMSTSHIISHICLTPAVWVNRKKKKPQGDQWSNGKCRKVWIINGPAAQSFVRSSVPWLHGSGGLMRGGGPDRLVDVTVCSVKCNSERHMCTPHVWSHFGTHAALRGKVAHGT